MLTHIEFEVLENSYSDYTLEEITKDDIADLKEELNDESVCNDEMFAEICELPTVLENLRLLC